MMLWFSNERIIYHTLRNTWKWNYLIITVYYYKLLSGYYEHPILFLQMEDKFKNLEYGVKVLSSVAMQRKISPLNADDNQQNNVGSLLSASEGK